MRVMLIIATCIALAGCAVGNKVDYTSAHPILKYSGKNKLAVGVQDKRSYIVSKDKNNDFVGIMRGGFGNPFDVTTSSKNAFSEDITKVLVEAMNGQSQQIAQLSVAPNTNKEEIIQNIKNSNFPKTLVLTVNQWESDTKVFIGYRRTHLFFDLDMEVFNQTGGLLAKKRIDGVEEIEGGYSSVGSNAPDILKNKIEELFAGDISKTLNAE